MKRNEMRAEISRMVASGMTRSSIFRSLSGQGVGDRKLAWLIASSPDPRRCEANRLHIWVVVVIACVQAAIGCVEGVGLGEAIVPGTGWIIGAVTAVLGLWFAWGFHRNQAGVYNAYLLMAIVQLPFQLGDLPGSPVGTVVETVAGVAALAYVWWVRTRIFPDFAFLSPRKVKGAYVFSD